MSEKLVKASIHFKELEWKEFKDRLEKERTRTGYKISVNKFLRKIVIGDKK